ncbi:MAG TPA: chromosome segregation protein SMC, partial [Nitrosarchaeum sp.]|nr:chromosome segregation protein SMC [Nitrosarchaeum sp.]
MESTGNVQQFTNPQIIEKIQYFIDTNKGDVGRLYHILEHFKQNKPLYQSDKNYLESKLNVSFEIIDEKKPNDNPVLLKIQSLINAET